MRFVYQCLLFDARETNNKWGGRYYRIFRSWPELLCGLNVMRLQDFELLKLLSRFIILNFFFTFTLIEKLCMFISLNFHIPIPI